MDSLFWPHFLDLLESDANTAGGDFYLFTEELLTRTRPSAMCTLTSLGEDRQDLIHDFVLHCIQNDFAVIRKYKNHGNPFRCWLYVVAEHFFLDKLREKGRTPKCISIDEVPEVRVLIDGKPNPVKELKQKELIKLVGRMTEHLDEDGRLLLVLAAREFTPKEMVKLLRLPSNQNKRISDDLRNYRQRLKESLARAGINIVCMLNA